jgi:hypothetical protein
MSQKVTLSRDFVGSSHSESAGKRWSMSQKVTLSRDFTGSSDSESAGSLD